MRVIGVLSKVKFHEEVIPMETIAGLVLFFLALCTLAVGYACTAAGGSADRGAAKLEEVMEACDEIR